MFKTRCNKFKYSSESGFTLLELVAVLSLLSLLFSIVFLYVRPLDQLKKGRDRKRLSDISTLDRAISEFALDEKRYPDQIDTLRKSNVLPTGSSNVSNANLGWIYDNLSRYTPSLPIDPVNDSTYHYSYTHNGKSYELNAKMEYLTNEMQNDGGNDPLNYEQGNNLKLISP